MTTSLLLVFIWAVAANLAESVWPDDTRLGRAVVLIATGVPLLGFVTWENGPWIGLLALAAGMCMLRWPLVFGAGWLRRKSGGMVD